MREKPPRRRALPPWTDPLVAAVAIVLSVSRITGTYLGRRSVTYLDDNHSPFVSAAGALRLMLFAVSLIVAAFLTAAAVG